MQTLEPLRSALFECNYHPFQVSRCLNEINYLKNRKNFLVREGYEAERRSRSDEALYAITTIRRTRALTGQSHQAQNY